MSSKDKQKIAVFTYLLLGLVYILRATSVGVDYENYISKISNIYAHFSWEDYGLLDEPLYGAINYLVYNMGGFPWLLSLIIFSIYVLFITKATSDLNQKVLVVLLLFISYNYFDGFNTIRQFIATGLILIALNRLQNNKNVQYIIYCLIAGLFHKSAIFLIPFLCLRYLKINRIVAVLVIICSFIFIMLKLDYTLMSDVANRFLLFQNNYEITDFNQYNQYFGDEQTGLNFYGKLSKYLILIFDSVIFLITIYGKKVSVDDKSIDVYSKFWLVGLAYTIITCHFSWLFRFGYYFLSSLLLCIPYTFEKIDTSKRKMWVTTIVFISCVSFALKLYGNLDGVLPYKMLF